MMRPALFALTSILLLGGCAAIGGMFLSLGAPKAPELKTPEGRACVRKCQQNYRQCLMDLPPAPDGGPGSDQQCIQNLRACYDICAAGKKK